MVETVMGFDFGYKKIGVALGQSLTATASPLVIVPCRNSQPDWPSLTGLIEQWRPHRLVVGLPLGQDGQDTHLSLAARRFINQLQTRFTLPVEGVNEYLSSHAAAARLGGHRAPLDAVAAQIIVETWLAQRY